MSPPLATPAPASGADAPPAAHRRQRYAGSQSGAAERRCSRAPPADSADSVSSVSALPGFEAGTASSRARPDGRTGEAVVARSRGAAAALNGRRATSACQ